MPSLAAPNEITSHLAFQHSWAWWDHTERQFTRTRHNGCIRPELIDGRRLGFEIVNTGNEESIEPVLFGLPNASADTDCIKGFVYAPQSAILRGDFLGYYTGNPRHGGLQEFRDTLQQDPLEDSNFRFTYDSMDAIFRSLLQLPQTRIEKDLDGLKSLCESVSELKEELGRLESLETRERLTSPGQRWDPILRRRINGMIDIFRRAVPLLNNELKTLTQYAHQSLDAMHSLYTQIEKKIETAVVSLQEAYESVDMEWPARASLIEAFNLRLKTLNAELSFMKARDWKAFNDHCWESQPPVSSLARSELRDCEVARSYLSQAMEKLEESETKMDEHEENRTDRAKDWMVLRAEILDRNTAVDTQEGDGSMGS